MVPLAFKVLLGPLVPLGRQVRKVPLVPQELTELMALTARLVLKAPRATLVPQELTEPTALTAQPVLKAPLATLVPLA